MKGFCFPGYLFSTYCHRSFLYIHNKTFWKCCTYLFHLTPQSSWNWLLSPLSPLLLWKRLSLSFISSLANPLTFSYIILFVFSVAFDTVAHSYLETLWLLDTTACWFSSCLSGLSFFSAGFFFFSPGLFFKGSLGHLLFSLGLLR